VFVEVDINSINPAVQTFASNPIQSPVAGGPPIDIAAPTAIPSVTPPVPEPGSLALLVTALGIGSFAAGLGRFSLLRSWN
jgi:hypothetical protein